MNRTVFGNSHEVQSSFRFEIIFSNLTYCAPPNSFNSCLAKKKKRAEKMANIGLSCCFKEKTKRFSSSRQFWEKNHFAEKWLLILIFHKVDYISIVDWLVSQSCVSHLNLNPIFSKNYLSFCHNELSGYFFNWTMLHQAKADIFIVDVLRFGKFNR